MKRIIRITLILLLVTIIILTTVNNFTKYQNNIYNLKKELFTYTVIENNEIYTTKTYNEFIKTKGLAIEIINNKYASQKDIENAKSNLISAARKLKTAKQIKYLVNFSTEIKSNNCVGNDWNIVYKTKNSIINNNSEILINLNDTPIFYCEIIEKDKFPDTGTSEFVFTDTTTSITNELEIIENKGKYKNNMAVWEINCTLTFQEYL